LNTKNTLHDREILDVIGILSANGESGSLQMKAGTTEGAFFFKHGRLVDAHVGNLTGFQAVNAAASMRDASLSFDPSVAPPSISSIKPSERVVLKQFFGIETAVPEESNDSGGVIWPDDDLTASEITPVAAEQNINDDEATLVRSSAPSAEPLPVMPPPHQPSRRSPYRNGLLLAFLLVLTAAASFALVYRFRVRSATASVATKVESPAPAPSVVESSAPPVAEPVKKAETVKQNDIQATAAAQDLTGKWNVVNTVEQTSFGSFKNLKIGFNLSINQNGKGFTGRGEKVSENGRSLPANSRTPILVKGSINGDRVEATFSEVGTTRKTNGRFLWRIDKAGALTGTFVSSAARTSGKSAAQKEL
jgi:Domain of unknown function (DUF4388)